MDAQTFLGNFGTIAEAPGGVDRLRELILDLAVHGQLVPQDPNDQPVSCEQLAAGRKSLLALRQISKPRHPQGRAVEKPPYSIPATWRWYHLGDVGAVVGGGTPSSQESRFWADGNAVAWLTPADMRGQTSRYVTQGERDITEEGLASSSAQLLPARSVLFSSRAPIGHVGIAQTPLATNQGFKSSVPYLPGMSEYLCLFLKKVGPEVSDAATGTTFKEVSGKQVALIAVPVPPLAEQERIVAKVDELMQLCDDLEARQQARQHVTTRLRASTLDALTSAETDDDLHTAWSRIHTNWEALTDHSESIEALRGTILGMAIRGRLSAQDPADEPASSLLSRIHAERQEFAARGRIKKPTSNPGVPDAPFALPETWAWVRLGSAALEIRYGTSAKSEPDGSVPVLRMGNLQSGEIDWTNLKYTSDEAEIAKYHLPSPAVLFNRTNSKELVGKTAIYRGERPAIFAGYLIHVRCSLGLDPEYLNLVLNTPMAKSWCWAVKTDGISQSNISASKLAEFPFPLAPLDEQRRIAKRVSQLLDQCADLSRALAMRDESAAPLSATAVAMA